MRDAPASMREQELDELRQRLCALVAERLTGEIGAWDHVRVGERYESRGYGLAFDAAGEQESVAVAARMQEAMYEPVRGTWVRIRVTVGAHARPNVQFDYDERPAGTVFDDEAFAEELARHPRDLPRIPDWWQAAVGYSHGQGRIVSS